MTARTPRAFMTSGAEGLYDFGRLLAGGAAAEVLAGYNDVAGLYLPCQFGPEGRKAVGSHVLYCLECQVLGGNDDIGVDVVAEEPDFTCKLFHDYSSL